MECVRLLLDLGAAVNVVDVSSSLFARRCLVRYAASVTVAGSLRESVWRITVFGGRVRCEHFDRLRVVAGSVIPHSVFAWRGG